jgi:mxaJ protein
MSTLNMTRAIALAAAVALGVATAGCGNESAHASAAPALRVCADPNNLPFSDSARAGFENRIADLVADELDRDVQYTWWAQRRGFVRNTLNAHECDVVMGIPVSSDMLLPTRPYYRSTYVFATRTADSIHIASLDDAQLRTLRVGVQVIGDDYSNAPPAHALAQRGIVDNVTGYTVIGDYSKPHPAWSIMSALADGDIDVAIVWGPLAGYYARNSAVPMSLAAVSPQIDTPFMPFVFDISMGVRREDSVFQRTLNDIIVRRRPGIDSILREYGVPRVEKSYTTTAEVTQ